MYSPAAREVRYLRRSLAWVTVAVAGVTLLAAYSLGLFSTTIAAGVQPTGAPPQNSPYNPWPLILLVVSLALIVGGLFGLGWQHRSYRRALAGREPRT